MTTIRGGDVAYVVFVPCAGLGTRLGDLTRHLPKAMVGVSLQPAISRLLKQFPADTRFVIALGYKGEVLREYLELVHSDRDICFVDVDRYEGPGSGLGYTLLCAEAQLQEPFVFCSCDTLVTGDIPAPEKNWAAWSDTVDLSSFRTLDIVPPDSQVQSILEKGCHGLDSRAYIGLSGIADWQSFWEAMHEGGVLAIEQGEAWGLNALCAQMPLDAIKMIWHDIGAPAALAEAERVYPAEIHATILPKENEAIWFVDGQAIKFSTDTDFIAKRVERVSHLEGFVPALSRYSAHFYAYAQISGEVLSRVAQRDDLLRLLDYCQSFWRPVRLDERQKQAFNDACMRFYRDKTFDRVALFYENFGREDNATLINRVSMPSLASLLEAIDWESLADGLAGRFHGDLHFENILATSDGSFCFLDWRQEFCGETAFGDIYYDLAKLNHGLIVNHELIAEDCFTAIWEGETITYDFHRYQRLVDCELVFSEWLSRHGYDVRKMRILTALVYLNIAALHHLPYSLMLYGLGKTMLYRELINVD